jgi:hypothetical protein
MDYGEVGELAFGDWLVCGVPLLSVEVVRVPFKSIYGCTRYLYIWLRLSVLCAATCELSNSLGGLALYTIAYGPCTKGDQTNIDGK